MTSTRSTTIIRTADANRHRRGRTWPRLAGFVLLASLYMGAACDRDSVDDQSMPDATAVVESLQDAGIDCVTSGNGDAAEAGCQLDGEDISVRTFVDDEARDRYLERSEIFSPVVLAPRTLVVVSDEDLADEVARALDGEVRGPGEAS